VRTGYRVDNREAEAGSDFRAGPSAVWPAESLERMRQEIAWEARALRQRRRW